MAVKRLEQDFLEKVKVPVERETLSGSNLYKYLKYRIWVGEVPPTQFLMEGDIWRQPIIGNPDVWQMRVGGVWVSLLASSAEAGLMSSVDKARLDDVVIKNTAGDVTLWQTINSNIKLHNQLTIDSQLPESAPLNTDGNGIFTTDTKKNIIYFNQTAGNTDAGAIIHETSGTAPDNTKGVLHLCPSDNAVDDYVAISHRAHGGSPPDSLFGTNTKLYTSGKIECVEINTTSARAKKFDIGLTELNATEFLGKVDVVDFIFKNDPKKTQRIGFIADDTDPLISGPEQNQMDHANLLGVLIKANQELAARVKELEEK